MPFPRVSLLAVAAIAAALFISCSEDDDDFDASKYAGTYTGTWTNAAGVTGPATIAIDVDESAKTASLTLDFGGNYLGLGDPPPVTLSGVFDDERATVKGKSELFGDYDVTIEKDGSIVGLMQNVGGGIIPKLTYTGTVTEDSLDADYEVTFKDNTVAQSTLRMTK
jgi:hypothetical protein